MIAFFFEDPVYQIWRTRTYVLKGSTYVATILKHHHRTLLWSLSLRQELRLSLWKQNADENI
jgi:hypothetical protein